MGVRFMSMLKKNQELEELEQKLLNWNRKRGLKPAITEEKLRELRDFQNKRLQAYQDSISRTEKYRIQWTSAGKKQRSYWLSSELVNQIKLRAIKEGIKDSTLVEKLLRKVITIERNIISFSKYLRNE